MIDWDYYRGLFPVLEGRAYFMTAGAGAIPTPVYEAISDAYKNVVSRGGSAFGLNIQVMEECRTKLAALINVDKENIAFIPHVSFGMNALAHSMPRNEVTLIPEEDFPSSSLPWENAGHLVERVSSTPGLQNNLFSMIEAAQEPLTVVTSHVQYSTGYKLQLDKLQDVIVKNNSRLILNGTQGIGAFPLDVKKLELDALICSCYKWMCCGEGISFMYVSPQFFRTLKPAFVGWRSVESSMSFNNQKPGFYKSARIFEIGWDNMTIFAGFSKALDMISDIGLVNIEKRINDLMSYLIDGLCKLGAPFLSSKEAAFRSNILLLGPFENLSGLMTELENNNVFVNQRGVGIRIALHFYNNEADVDALLRVLGPLLGKF